MYTDFVFSCIHVYDIVSGDMNVQLSSYDFFGHILHNCTQLSRSLKSHTQSLYTKCTLKDLINCKFSVSNAYLQVFPTLNLECQMSKYKKYEAHNALLC